MVKILSIIRTVENNIKGDLYKSKKLKILIGTATKGLFHGQKMLDVQQLKTSNFKETDQTTI